MLPCALISRRASLEKLAGYKRVVNYMRKVCGLLPPQRGMLLGLTLGACGQYMAT